MQNNDVLRRIRFATDLADHHMQEMIVAGGGDEITRETLTHYLEKEGSAGHVNCPDNVLSAFLNGLIKSRRGDSGKLMAPELTLNNNLILKKCRVAFSLKDSDISQILALAGFVMAKPELNALFQKPSHKNYKPCGDQVLKKFLLGLTRKLRPTDTQTDTQTDT